MEGTAIKEEGLIANIGTEREGGFEDLVDGIGEEEEEG